MLVDVGCRWVMRFVPDLYRHAWAGAPPKLACRQAVCDPLTPEARKPSFQRSICVETSIRMVLVVLGCPLRCRHYCRQLATALLVRGAREAVRGGARPTLKTTCRCSRHGLKTPDPLLCDRCSVAGPLPRPATLRRRHDRIPARKVTHHFCAQLGAIRSKSRRRPRLPDRGPESDSADVIVARIETVKTSSED